MDKFFKRTLVGAAVAAAAVSGSANAAISLVGDAVQLYGQAAGSIIITDDQTDNSVQADIESRIGFRGVVDFEDLEPNFIWQMEGGNANNGTNSGGLGVRDTYLGFDWEGFGSIKYGRQLVAAYNYVDWPHSNPGLGAIFDGNNDLGATKVTYQDRADHVIRYDSANFGGFNFQATLSGMEANTDALVASVAGSYTTEVFNLHAGYYDRGEYTEANVVNNANNYYIVGGSLFLGDVTLTAGYKNMELEMAGGDDGQQAYSVTGQYVIDGKWVLKAGYAATSSTDLADAAGDDDSDKMFAARVGYNLPSAFLYVDVRDYDYDGDTSTEDNTKILLGAEYYF